MRIDNALFVDAQGIYASRRILLSKTAISGTIAQVDFTFPDGFESFEIWAKNVLVDTDDVTLQVRLSDDYATTFKSGATNYEYARLGSTAVEGQQIINGSTGAALIDLGHTTAALAIGNASGEGIAGLRLIVNNPHSTTMAAMVTGQHWYLNATTADPTAIRFFGQLIALTRISGIRFMLESGSFTSGLFHLYGITGA